MLGLRWDISEFLRIASRFAGKIEIKEPEKPAAPEVQEGAYDVEWVDLRDEKKPSRGKSKGQRPWERITGACLHQTAVVITDPERCLGVPVHACVLPGKDERSCVIVLLHDPTDYMYHANGFNRRDIGIEVAARACGIEGDPRTLWLPKKYRHLDGEERLAKATEATDGQLEGCRRLLRYYIDMAKENGGRVEYIHAHRQSHSSRVSDPGSRIWKACGEWAREGLGLKVGPPDFAIGGGNPLPDAWTGRANGQRYNWRVDGRL